MEAVARPFNVIEQVLVEGLQDVLTLDWIYSVCRANSDGDPLETRALAIGVTAELIVEQMVSSRVWQADGWHDWGGGEAELLAKIVRDWLETGADGPPKRWSIAKFELSAKGQMRARSILSNASPLE
jgi:hypothetical protein